MKKILRLLLIIPLLTGCAIKAGPAAPSGFLSHQPTVHSPEIPFHRVWFKPGFTWRRYTNFAISPVNTEYLKEGSWWQKTGRGAYVEEDAKELADYTEYIFKAAFLMDNQNRFELVDRPNDYTLVAEIALVELVPNKAVLDSVALVGGPIGKGVGTIVGNLMKQASQSTIAFEARIKDGVTGEVLATFADREAEKSSLINYKHFTWYGHSKSIIREWAYQFVKVTNREPWETIYDSKPFELKPW